MGYAAMDIDIRKLAGIRPANPTPNASKGNIGSSSAGAPVEQSASDNSGVSVKLTDAAALLQSAKEALRQSPDVDHNKVATLKEAIASGRYQVDANRVAAKFLNLEPGV